MEFDENIFAAEGFGKASEAFVGGHILAGCKRAGERAFGITAERDEAF